MKFIPNMTPEVELVACIRNSLGEFHTYRETIVAWASEKGSCLQPVTASGSIPEQWGDGDGNFAWGVHDPRSGMVCANVHGYFNCVEDFTQSMDEVFDSNVASNTIRRLQRRIKVMSGGSEDNRTYARELEEVCASDAKARAYGLRQEEQQREAAKGRALPQDDLGGVGVVDPRSPSTD